MANQEIARRRTFAIIAHPDAGKTSLTEKLLLFGGQIQVAGAVKSNKIRKTATPHLFKKDNRFPATFRTLEKSVLLTATKDSTFHLISKYPDMLKSFLCVSGNCNVCTTMRLDVLSRKTIRERILVYLLKRLDKDTSTVKLTHTLTQLAEYINVTRPALSTEFNKMEKEGILKRKEGNYIELNRKAIKGII